MKVTRQEVFDVLVRGARGEIPVVNLEASTWPSYYAGDMRYRFGDWEVVIFNDCGELDYIDSVTAPDGRKGEFTDWIEEGEPSRGLLPEDRYKLELALGSKGYLNGGLKAPNA